MPCDACTKARELGKLISTWTRAGMPLARRDELQTRLYICKSCEHFKDGFCGKCGCVIFIKARLATSQCPAGKW